MNHSHYAMSHIVPAPGESVCISKNPPKFSFKKLIWLSNEMTGGFLLEEL